MNKNLQKAMFWLDGMTFEDSGEMLTYLKRMNEKFPTLQSYEWIEILKHAQECIMIGFEVECRRNKKEEVHN